MGKVSQCAENHSLILLRTSQGIGRKQIASEIGATHTALAAYMARRGIASGGIRGPGIRVDRNEIRRLIEIEGLTQPQAAKALGCERSAIERASKKMQLKNARTGPRAGQGHQEWKGGRVLDKHGYVEVYAPLHPRAKTPTGRIVEHRLVMEVVLGRYLLASEVVDHIDNHPQHNWPSNLRVFASNADHLRATLTGLWASSPRPSMPGVLRCNRPKGHCPSLDETLAQCPSETRRQVERFFLIHQPTTEQKHLARSTLLRSGATHDPFPQMSTE